MENLPKSGEGAAEENKKQNPQSNEKKSEKRTGQSFKVSREHDFTHTHPTHAKHKTFGADHEPGAI
jgi:hypothetical protein